MPTPPSSPRRIAAAAAETGIGLTLLPVFYSQGGFGGAPPVEGQRRFVSDVDCVSAPRRRGAEGRRRPRRRGRRHRAAQPARRHAGRAARGPRRRPRTVRCTSMSPSRSRRSRIASPGRARGPSPGSSTTRPSTRAGASSTRPISTLPKSAASPPRGAVAGLCPITEANLGDGIFPAAAFLEAGGRFGVGSDSNVEITAPGELRQLEYGQRLAHRARNVLAAKEGESTGRALYEGALAGGAQAAGTAGRRARPGPSGRHSSCCDRDAMPDACSHGRPLARRLCLRRRPRGDRQRLCRRRRASSPTAATAAARRHRRALPDARSRASSPDRATRRG